MCIYLNLPFRVLCITALPLPPYLNPLNPFNLRTASPFNLFHLTRHAHPALYTRDEHARTLTFLAMQMQARPYLVSVLLYSLYSVVFGNTELYSLENLRLRAG